MDFRARHIAVERRYPEVVDAGCRGSQNHHATLQGLIREPPVVDVGGRDVRQRAVGAEVVDEHPAALVGRYLQRAEGYLHDPRVVHIEDQAGAHPSCL